MMRAEVLQFLDSSPEGQIVEEIAQLLHDQALEECATLLQWPDTKRLALQERIGELERSALLVERLAVAFYRQEQERRRNKKP